MFDMALNTCLYFSVFLLSRSSHAEVFCKKGVLKNFANFTVKHLCWRLFFNKVKKRISKHRCFPVSFAKLLRTPFLQNTSGGCLLLSAVFSCTYDCKINFLNSKRTYKKCFIVHGVYYIPFLCACLFLGLTFNLEHQKVSIPLLTSLIFATAKKQNIQKGPNFGVLKKNHRVLGVSVKVLNKTFSRKFSGWPLLQQSLKFNVRKNQLRFISLGYSVGLDLLRNNELKFLFELKTSFRFADIHV